MHWKRGVAAVIGLIGAVGLVVGGVAVALWTATGTGSGNAQALTAQTITVTAVTGTADLYPGFTAGDLSFSMNNPNPYGVTFTSWTAGTVTSSDPVDCPASNVTVDDSSGLSLSVAGGATTPGVIADVVSMSALAPDECQGVIFTVALTLSGSQT